MPYLVKKLIPPHLFRLLQPLYHFFLALLAALFYGFPSRRLTVIGVTGTKGKTTVVELLHEIFAVDASGTTCVPSVPVASVSSLRFKIGDKEIRNMKRMTMPGRFFLQKFLHDARRAGCRYVILEVTSEGVKQYRHRFINFSAAVMTNIAPEHIEAHGSFEKYLRAKLDLFWRLPKGARAIINREDPYADRFSAATAGQKIWYRNDVIVIGDKKYSVSFRNTTTLNGLELDLNGVTVSSSLAGEFNVSNILAAVATALSFRISLDKIALAIAKVKIIPGRMEFIQAEPFAVIVDYAHTPDSLKRVYTFLKSSTLSTKDKVSSRQEAQDFKLLCVLGAAGGGRDRWKRPEMGRIAAEFCDQIIITSEDPYDEDPQSIIKDIEGGIPPGYKPQTISYLERREAIRAALKFARPRDIVIITGKGAEPWIMGPANTKIPWDDREVVREELEKIRRKV